MEFVVDRLMELGKRFKPDQFEAYASRNRVITIRIATNQIVEAKEIHSFGHSVRFIKNKSVGFCSSDGTENLQKTVEKAERLSRSKDKDIHFKSLPKPKKIKKLKDGFDKKILNFSLADGIKLGEIALQTALDMDKNFDVSGSINIISEECWIRNSLGIDCSDKNTMITSSITVEKEEEVSAIGNHGSRLLKKFDPKFAALQAATTAKESLQGVKIKPGKYKIIFSPYAMAELLEHEIAFAITAPSFDSKSSYFYNKFGKKVATKSFTLYDDGRNVEGIASKTIDDEGIPTKKTKIIDKGILVNLISDSYYANKLKPQIKSLKATGNGFRFGAVPGRNYFMLPYTTPTNFVIEKGKQSLEELIEQTKNGLLVGRIWYTYLINPTIGEFSTTNRGGTFLIKNGKISKPVLPNSFRINDNIQKLLKNIVGISKEQKQSIIWGGTVSSISPSILFDNVNVIAYK
jgi:PmbA protein